MCRGVGLFQPPELDNLIGDYRIVETNNFFTIDHGGFTCQVPLRILDGFHHIMDGFHICFQVAGLVPKQNCRSICWISCWWMEMFEGCCGEVQKGCC